MKTKSKKIKNPDGLEWVKSIADIYRANDGTWTIRLPGYRCYIDVEGCRSKSRAFMAALAFLTDLQNACLAKGEVGTLTVHG